jgi:transglutaminase-like putative cysteine protease
MNPSVQAIIQKIKKNKPFLKHGDIAFFPEIFSELNGIFGYDDNMVSFYESNIPIHASELIKIGKGVCHHFSVLHVAIARGLGIPARTVFGPHVSERGVANHAWIEILDQRNRWIPYDPQTGSLVDRGYFPVQVAEIFEKRRLSLSKNMGFKNLIRNVSPVIEPWTTGPTP